MTDRKALRSKILATKPKSKVVEAFDDKIEVRQPRLGEILNAQTSDDRPRAIALMMVRYCFVPGTNETIFEEEDIDMILDLPMGGDIARLQEAISEMTEINLKGEEGNSEEAQQE